MNSFSYVRADSPGAAIAATARDPDAAFLAGGTNLIDYMKEGSLRPHTLVDIRRLPLAEISELNGGLRLGALATNTAVAYHPLVQRRYPVLAEALLSGASPQLRNAATVGGNILQRTRCYYFRDVTFPCNKRAPGSGCSAIDGYNRIHAVLGCSPQCIASHPSDMCVALAALDAVVQVEGPSGSRSIPFVDFHRVPGSTPQIECVLNGGELITAVDLPSLPFATNSHYIKVRERASYEFALVSVGAALEVGGGTIRQARLALGGVGTKPWRSHEAEAALIGKPANVDNFRQAAETAMAGAEPHEYNAYKIELAKRTIVLGLTEVARKSGVAI